MRFEVRVRRHEALDCACSICTQKGYIHLIVDRDDFTLLSGEETLRTYTFGTHTAAHHFCDVCGIHSFYVPRSHPEGIDVNVRCLDGDVLARFHVTPFDGQRWEEEVHKIR